jgi:hypothetical protein
MPSSEKTNEIRKTAVRIADRKTTARIVAFVGRRLSRIVTAGFTIASVECGVAGVKLGFRFQVSGFRFRVFRVVGQLAIRDVRTRTSPQPETWNLKPETSSSNSSTTDPPATSHQSPIIRT